jgi:peptidoglycan/xylan/chitin deacetylase (PgdA/CDA1 family)
MPDTQRWATQFADVRRGPAPLSAAALRAGARSAFLRLAGSLAQPRERSFLRCLYLHYVYDDQVERFRALLRALQKIGDFVTADEAVAIARGEKPLVRRCFHLSIDDGFDNVHRNAFPVLCELDVPATLFVPSAWIGTPEPVARDMWWMHDSAPVPTRPMTWEQLREMSRYGYEIGSHTRRHARLSDVSGDPQRLADEVAGSRREIEDAVGRPCRYIAWPFGTARDVDEASLAAVEEAGYEGCFSALRGRVTPGVTSRFSIPRHHFEPEWPRSHVCYFALGGRE